MLNTYDSFTRNSIFRPKAFIKKKNMHFNINYVVSVPPFWNRDYVVDIDIHVFFIKAFGLNIELGVKLSYVNNVVVLKLRQMF